MLPVAPELVSGRVRPASPVVVEVVGDALPLPACVLFDKLSRGSVSARSPPRGKPASYSRKAAFCGGAFLSRWPERSSCQACAAASLRFCPRRSRLSCLFCDWAVARHPSQRNICDDWKSGSLGCVFTGDWTAERRMQRIGRHGGRSCSGPAANRCRGRRLSACPSASLAAGGRRVGPGRRAQLPARAQGDGQILAPQPQTAIVSYSFPGESPRSMRRLAIGLEEGQTVIVLESQEVGEAKSEFFVDRRPGIGEAEPGCESCLRKTGLGSRRPRRGGGGLRDAAGECRGRGEAASRAGVHRGAGQGDHRDTRDQPLS